MVKLIDKNPSLLLLMQHFEVDFCVDDKTVSSVCCSYDIDLNAFTVIANLYNGFYPEEKEIDNIKDIKLLIRFLENSHSFYKNDKYPEIINYIKELKNSQNTENILLIEKFFNSYFNEVLEHFDYEDKIAFPYFKRILEDRPVKANDGFSVNEYRIHHTDIETKLDDLKNLLLKHVSLTDDLPVRRKFLYGLFELEFDLQIHSVIEEKVLLPLIDKYEITQRNGKM